MLLSAERPRLKRSSAWTRLTYAAMSTRTMFIIIIRLLGDLSSNLSLGTSFKFLEKSVRYHHTYLNFNNGFIVTNWLMLRSQKFPRTLLNCCWSFLKTVLIICCLPNYSRALDTLKRSWFALNSPTLAIYIPVRILTLLPMLAVIL
jgi:hypothetical protein